MYISCGSTICNISSNFHYILLIIKSLFFFIYLLNHHCIKKSPDIWRIFRLDMKIKISHLKHVRAISISKFLLRLVSKISHQFQPIQHQLMHAFRA